MYFSSIRNFEKPAAEFYNSVGGAAFFERLLREISLRGYRTNLQCSLTEIDYHNLRGGMAGLRRRWNMYVAQSWKCILQSRSCTSTFRIVTTNPFYAPVLVSRFSRADDFTINLVYDLFPEALVQSGMIRPDSAIEKCIAKITRHAFQRCDATVFLGENLKAFAEDRYGAAKYGTVIPVGGDGQRFKNEPRMLADGEFVRVLYSGTMGRMHDFATLAEAIKKRLPSGLVMEVRAGGSGYKKLREQIVEENGIEWGGYLDDEAWIKSMQHTHVSIVTVATGAERVVMPSKTYSSLLAGHAILAICADRSDLADLVRSHNCGWVIRPGDSDELHSVLQRIARRPAEVFEKRVNAFNAGHSHYDMSTIAARWIMLFDGMRDLRRGKMQLGSAS